jgi:hypothetical protein
VAQRDIIEAVATCRASGLSGWALVDEAARLVSLQFATYSVLHPWESPDKAFRQRRGYCLQYNGALATILQQLGIGAWLVFAERVHFDDGPDWSLGHTWVRAGIESEVRDVCARSADNRSGCVHFTPIGPVRKLGGAVRVASAMGSYGAALAAVTRARLRGEPRPEWVEHPR